jgi:hypothetical protein
MESLPPQESNTNDDTSKPKIIQLPGKIITTTGVKPAASKTHDVLRTFLFVLIMLAIIYTIHHEKSHDVTLDDVCDVIKPGTIMYNSISEMEPDIQRRYLKSLQDTLSEDDPKLVKKYSNGLKVALIAGIASEYIINGNTSKPIGIIAKTIMYTSIYTMVSS